MKVLSQQPFVLKSIVLEAMSEQIQTLCPLYSSLFEMTRKSELNMNWAASSAKIATLNEKEMEILYVLILCHFYTENKTFLDKKKMTPYKGKLMDGNRGILYTITELPSRLQQIIYQYLEIIRS